MNKYHYYIDQYKKAHIDPEAFPGISIRYYVKDINTLIQTTNSKTLLDFGCGKGEQYYSKELKEKWGKLPNEKWGIMPTLYDPAVEKYNKLPTDLFDGVISTDVMEHVPEDSTDFVLEQIFSKAKKFVFLAIATYVGKPTSRKLPNGEQPHITVHENKWWIKQIVKHTPNVKVWVSFNGRNKQRKQVFSFWKNFI